MNAEKFWLGWLKTVTIILIIAGLMMTILCQWGTLNYLNGIINHDYFGGGIPQDSVLIRQGWLIGICGAMLAGWSITLLLLIRLAVKKRESWAWYCLVYSIITWFIADSSVSLYFHAIYNMLFNLVLLLQFMAPLLFLRRSLIYKAETVS